MKHLYFLIVAAMLAAACTAGQKICTITGSFGDEIEVADGELVALVKFDGTPVDSCAVSDGAFTLSCPLDPASGVTVLYPADGDGDAFHAFVIPDSRSVSVCLAETPTVTGSPKSAEMNELQSEVLRISREYYQEYMECLMAGDKAGADSVSILQKDAWHSLCMDKYLDNTDNLVGVQALGILVMTVTDEEFVELYEKGGNVVKADGDLGGLYLSAKARLGTLDAEDIKVGDGDIVFKGVDSFHDYVGQGKFVLVDFWASWCGPCRELMPTIVDINGRYADKGLVVLGVAIQDDPEKSYEIAKQLGATYDQIVDPSGKLAEPFGFNSIPHLILFDPQGNVVKDDIPEDELEDLIVSSLGL